MDLASLQQGLLGLVKGTYRVTDDTPPYLRRVASSDHLAMVHEVVHWWRAFQASRFCVLTSAVLVRRAAFDAAITGFLREDRVSPFIEEFGMRFLERTARHPDPLVRSVAQFELALLKVKRGDPGDHMVDWGQDPTAVLAALLDDGSLDAIDAGRYRTVVSGRIPGFFSVDQVNP